MGATSRVHDLVTLARRKQDAPGWSFSSSQPAGVGSAAESTGRNLSILLVCDKSSAESMRERPRVPTDAVPSNSTAVSTKTSEHRFSNYTRAVDVHLEDRESAAHPADGLRVASISQFSSDGSALREPILQLGIEVANGYSAGYTRAQWEALKREIDAAWGVFEATWPQGADGR